MVDKLRDTTEIMITIPRHFPSGQIAAFNIDADVYMRDYAQDFYEWVNGVMLKMSPVSLRHNKIVDFLRDLLRAYFIRRQIGQVASAPFVMRLDAVGSRREPDLQVILNSNTGTLTDTYMDGPADICIEVVSPSNEGTDYGDKLREYEQGGVQEYWLIDPMRKQCRFHRLSDEGAYQLVTVEDAYTTPLLPDFKLATDVLWQESLPDMGQVMRMIDAMLDS